MYRVEEGIFKKIKSDERILELTNGTQITLDDIFKIEIDLEIPERKDV